MKISGLISALQSALKDHGDLDVVASDKGIESESELVTGLHFETDRLGKPEGATLPYIEIQTYGHPDYPKQNPQTQ